MNVWRLYSKFVKECSDVSYVAGEGVELAVHKETVVVQERKISLCAIYQQGGLWRDQFKE